MSSVAMDKRSSRSYGGGYVDVFDDTQSRTFLKWLNARLESANIPIMTNLATDLSDGVKLCQLMEIMSQTSLGRYNTNPRMRVQKADNVNRALQFIKGSGVILTNIGPEDIIDGNLKLVLGMIWTLILRFTIADINEEGLSAKEGLLLWCQRKTAPYEEVEVDDFSHSWKDGLAFCALLHRHRPDLLDWDKLDKADPHACTKLAFTLAEWHLNIPQLLEVADICDVSRPDERSVMTYIAQYFHAFTVADRADALARRVTMFADTLDGVWSSRNDYERKAAELVRAISSLLSHWSSTVLAAAYEQAKAEAHAFADYKMGTKRKWVGQKADLAGLLGNISTKLRTYSMKPYFPPDGLTQKDIDQHWHLLLLAETQRSKAINANIRQIKEQLRKRYADLANACQSALSSIEVQLASVDGLPEVQLRSVADLQERTSHILAATLLEAEYAEQLCRAASIEENDYTVYTYEDLAFEAGLVRDNVAKKRAFLENQIVARTSTKLTPAQLEEFESTFRHFDRDQTNTLGLNEFSAALAALGIIYSDADTVAIHEQLSGGIDGLVTFQAWIDFLTDITEDQTTPDQVRESFAGIAKGKPFVTELDLNVALVPANTVEFLKKAVPAVHATNGAAGSSDSDTVLDFHTFLDNIFA